MVNIRTKTLTMPEDKIVATSFRVSPTFKALLDFAAARVNSSMVNVLDIVVFAGGQQYGLSNPLAKVRQCKGAKI
jgi:hypothetical protein